MELKDERRIAASRDAVFAALNDPEVLRQCIPGCEALEKVSDTEMTATVSLKVGPVKARFLGKVELSNINPPTSYTITGEGRAGPAGAARGGADVVLVEDGDATLLQYTVKAEVIGKLAQLGGRLIDSTARTLATQFFDKFAGIVGGGAASAEAAAPMAAATAQPRLPPQAWMILGAAVVVVAALLLLIVVPRLGG
ncbi:MAG: SRPBCC family protein [Devosia sp.]